MVPLARVRVGGHDVPQRVVEVAVQQTALVLRRGDVIEAPALLDHRLVRGLAGLGFAGLRLERVLTIWNNESNFFY